MKTYIRPAIKTKSIDGDQALMRASSQPIGTTISEESADPNTSVLSKQFNWNTDDSQEGSASYSVWGE